MVKAQPWLFMGLLMAVPFFAFAFVHVSGVPIGRADVAVALLLVAAFVLSVLVEHRRLIINRTTVWVIWLNVATLLSIFGYRVILLLGDNLGDFQDIGGMSVAERAEIFDAHREKWGTRWIMIPNPSYGSWEQTLYDFQYDLSPRDKQERKLQALDAWQPSP